MLQHRYALKGLISGELITHNNRIIVHNNRAELEFLFGLDQGKAQKVEITTVSEALLRVRPSIRLRDTPDCADLEFPLNRADFLEMEVPKCP